MVSKLVSLVGIDGSGKSTLAKHLLSDDQSPFKERVICCPRYHENKFLSKTDISHSQFLDFLNVYAEQRQDPTAKAIAVFAQTRLFSKIYQNFSDSLEMLEENKGGHRIFSERHPVIDSLVYGPVLAKNINYDYDVENFIKEARDSYPLLSKNDEHLIFPEILSDIKSLYSKNLDIESFKNYFKVPLPHQIIFLQIPVDQALLNIKNRPREADGHENLENLRWLNQRYLEVFEALEVIGIKIDRLLISQGETLERTYSKLISISSVED